MLTKLILFGLVGGVNTVVDWAAFWLMGVLRSRAVQFVWFIKGASYCVGVLCSSVFNSSFTFRNEYSTLRARYHGSCFPMIFRFVIVALMGAGLNSITYVLFARGAYMNWAALMIATGVCFGTTFVLNKTWTYRLSV